MYHIVIQSDTNSRFPDALKSAAEVGSGCGKGLRLKKTCQLSGIHISSLCRHRNPTPLGYLPHTHPTCHKHRECKHIGRADSPDARTDRRRRASTPHPTPTTHCARGTHSRRHAHMLCPDTWSWQCENEAHCCMQRVRSASSANPCRRTTGRFDPYPNPGPALQGVRETCKAGRPSRSFSRLLSMPPTMTGQLLLQPSMVRPSCASAELADAIASAARAAASPPGTPGPSARAAHSP